MAKGNWRNWDARNGAEAPKRDAMRRCSYCGAWMMRSDLLTHVLQFHPSHSERQKGEENHGKGGKNMNICGECDNCGANHVAIRVEEEVMKSGVFLTRVCGICGYRMDAGSILRAQYDCAHREKEE